MRKSTLFLIFASALILFPLLCQAQSQGSFQPFQGEIIANDINIRADSTVSAETICVLKKGESVEVVSEFYEWYKIRLPKQAPSYISKSLLECIKYKTEERLAAGQSGTGKACLSAKLLGDRVNVRLHPDTSSAILGRIDKNEVVTVVGEEGEWYRILPIANSFGYIHKRFVKKSSPAEEGGLPEKELTAASLTQEEIAVTGIIKPYGRIFGRKATHKLITGDNKIFLLKGDKESLNALCNKRVRVIGKIPAAASKGNPIIEVKILEVDE